LTQKSITIKDKQFGYSVHGKGDPVVLLHGFAEDGDVWKYQLEDLAAGYFVIVPDLPGSGRSDMADDMSIEGMALCVKKIIEHELPANASLAEVGITMIGHSMGGYITLAFANKYPGLLAGFGLFHSTAFADTEEKKATRRRGIAFIQTHGSYEFIRQSTPNLFTEEFRIKNDIEVEKMMAQYGHFNPAALVAYYEAMIQRPNLTSVLQSFKKPILFIIGKQDKAIPFEDSMKQCHLPQMASVQILEKAAHMGMWEEKEKSSRALLSFLQFIQQFNRH